MKKITWKQLLFVAVYSCIHAIGSLCGIFAIASPEADLIYRELGGIGLTFMMINMPFALLTGAGGLPFIIIVSLTYAVFFLYLYKMFIERTESTPPSDIWPLKYHLSIFVSLLGLIFLLRGVTAYTEMEYKKLKERKRIEELTRTGYHKLFSDDRDPRYRRIQEEGLWVNCRYKRKPPSWMVKGYADFQTRRSSVSIGRTRKLIFSI